LAQFERKVNVSEFVEYLDTNIFDIR
jgi:hypothetical protein